MNRPTESVAVAATVGAVSAAILTLLWTRSIGEKSSVDEKLIEVTSSTAPVTPVTTAHQKLPGLGESLVYWAAEDPCANCIYLDYNATAPVYPEVFEAIKPYLSAKFANPSSGHLHGRTAKRGLEIARGQLGVLINAANPSKEIIFTSCGTESDNLAVLSALHHWKVHYKGSSEAIPRVITTEIEHPAVLSYLRGMEVEGKVELIVVGVDEQGFVDANAISDALTVNTAMVSVMHSNNEVGTIQMIRSIGRDVQNFLSLNREAVIVFHSDASQSVGKVPVDVQGLGVDMLTIAGQKFGAPKGAAALYVKEGVLVKPQLVGVGHEGGARSGTVNVAYAVGLGAAAVVATRERDSLLLHMLEMKTRLVENLVNALGDDMSRVAFNGPMPELSELKSNFKLIQATLKSPTGGQMAPVVVEQLPNTLSVSFKGLLGYEIVEHMGDQLACSSGAACHSSKAAATSCSNTTACGSPKMSAVLTALKVDPEFGLGTLRLTVGRHTTTEEVDRAAGIIAKAVRELWAAAEKK